MAGTVGCAVAGSPGYSGYVPSSEQPPTCSNSWVTQRLPVGSRCRVCQPTKGKLSPLARQSSPVRSGAADAAQPVDPSSFFLPKRLTESTVYSSDSARGSCHEPGRWEYPKTKTALLTDSQKKVKKGPLPTPFTACTQYAAAADRLHEGAEPAFFSRVKKAEQDDEESRTAEGVGSCRSTRAGAKEKAPTATRLRRRMQDADFAPPRAAFTQQERRPLLGAEPVAPSEYVKFKGTLSDTSSSRCEYGGRGFDPRSRYGSTPVENEANASTGDLFVGTAKATAGKRIPGYVGHVPHHQNNTGRMRLDSGDLVRENARNNILMTSGRKTLPGYSGFEPKSIYNDTGKPNEPPPGMTSTGAAARAAATGEESQLNQNEYGKAQGIRKFFSQGTGSADHVISDQYFIRYRPMEGMLRMGAPGERSIPIVH
eukprot:TRINITY_DN40207_c0_g1_i1.p1 TRINITY_DN40207_c0_g1~~TRINITY_DN40207_c0_g1_i1.p1  ORF type:complete len:445 (+),score=97.37 TRINITY_DN40207_c0_g1_i1:59-1336(+)